MTDTNDRFEGWAILELMGHRRLAGHVTETELAGQGVLRLDVPNILPGEGFEATQFYSPAALYCLTPTDEETARLVAMRAKPAPVQRWELPAPQVWDGDVPDTEHEDDIAAREQVS